MKQIALIMFGLFPICISAQKINEFVSLDPGMPNETFHFPCTHTFQKLVKEGDTMSYGGVLPGMNDFTCYVPINGQNDTGYLSLNHELNTYAKVTIHDIWFDASSQLWNTGQSKIMNFAGVAGAENLCSGGLMPWGNVVVAEEDAVNIDANGDGYEDIGWLIEIDPVTGTVEDHDNDGTPDKLWALGRTVHENISALNDSVFYYGAELTNLGFLYKFVADTPGDLSSGTLYALIVDSLTGSTGYWVQVANSTQAQRNQCFTESANKGATNFTNIEDVEVREDSTVFFVSTTYGTVYKFKDEGDSTHTFEQFVVDQQYPVQTSSGVVNVDWGTGHDNMAIDNDGNLWVLQDGGKLNIWVVGKDHSDLTPDIRIFGRAPLGSESTGITFSPDNRFMFISMQHPNITNTQPQIDIAGDSVIYDKSVTMVVARREYLGNSVNASNNLSSSYCENDSSTLLTGIPAGGVFEINGVQDTVFNPSDPGPGTHSVNYIFTDTAGCELYLLDTVTVYDTPNASFTGLPAQMCQNDSVVSLLPVLSGGAFSGLGTVGYNYDPASVSPGFDTVTYIYSDAVGCVDTVWQSVFIVAPSVVDAGSDLLVCDYETSEQLTSGSPTGGNWYGPFVDSSGIFDVNTAGQGTYTVYYQYDDANGCNTTDSLIVTVVNCTGIDEGSTDSSVNIFPNPAKDKFTISWSGMKVGSLIITDMAGREAEVDELIVLQSKAVVTISTPGIYLIHLNGKVSGKIIINRH